MTLVQRRNLRAFWFLQSRNKYPILGICSIMHAFYIPLSQVTNIELLHLLACWKASVCLIPKVDISKFKQMQYIHRNLHKLQCTLIPSILPIEKGCVRCIWYIAFRWTHQKVAWSLPKSSAHWNKQKCRVISTTPRYLADRANRLSRSKLPRNQLS